MQSRRESKPSPVEQLTWFTLLILALLLIAAFPELVTWSPGKIYGN